MWLYEAVQMEFYSIDSFGVSMVQSAYSRSHVALPGKNMWPDVQLSFPHAHIILLDDLSWPSKMKFNIWQARLSEFSGHMYIYFLINKIKINWLKIYLEVLH